MEILGAKQVGDVSYLVGDLNTLVAVINSQEIWASETAEVNPKTNKKQPFVSLARNLTAAANRNNKRWNCGVIIDGDKLSNKYHIEPYSYAGSGLKSNKYRVKTLTAYDNGTYKLNLVNWPAMEISKEFYDEIVDIINTMPSELKAKKNFSYTGEGKQARNGRKIVEKYHFNTKLGGPMLTYENLSDSAASYFMKHEKVNETEERIWLKPGQESVSIKNCIIGVVLSEKDAKLLESNTSDNEVYDRLYSAIEHNIGPNYILETY